MLTVTKAKSQFNALISSNEPVYISKNGEAIATIVPFKLYQEMYIAWRDAQYQGVLKTASKFQQGKNKDGINDKKLGDLLEQINAKEN